MPESPQLLAIAQRVQVSCERAEAHREAGEDIYETRDAAIFEAIDQHDVSIKRVAEWAKMSTANVNRIVYQQAHRAAG